MLRLHEHVGPLNVDIVKDLEQKISNLSSRVVKDTDRRSKLQAEYLQSELDGYIAAECPLCGSLSINLLTQPLVSENDVKLESKFWAL
jgi:hypothetical protein